MLNNGIQIIRAKDEQSEIQHKIQLINKEHYKQYNSSTKNTNTGIKQTKLQTVKIHNENHKQHELNKQNYKWYNFTTKITNNADKTKNITIGTIQKQKTQTPRIKQRKL